VARKARSPAVAAFCVCIVRFELPSPARLFFSKKKKMPPIRQPQDHRAPAAEKRSRRKSTARAAAGDGTGASASKETAASSPSSGPAKKKGQQHPTRLRLASIDFPLGAFAPRAELPTKSNTETLRATIPALHPAGATDGRHHHHQRPHPLLGGGKQQHKKRGSRRPKSGDMNNSSMADLADLALAEAEEIDLAELGEVGAPSSSSRRRKSRGPKFSQTIGGTTTARVPSPTQLQSISSAGEVSHNLPRQTGELLPDESPSGAWFKSGAGDGRDSLRYSTDANSLLRDSMNLPESFFASEKDPAYKSRQSLFGTDFLDDDNSPPRSQLRVPKQHPLSSQTAATAQPPTSYQSMDLQRQRDDIAAFASMAQRDDIAAFASMAQSAYEDEVKVQPPPTRTTSSAPSDEDGPKLEDVPSEEFWEEDSYDDFFDEEPTTLIGHILRFLDPTLYLMHDVKLDEKGVPYFDDWNGWGLAGMVRTFFYNPLSPEFTALQQFDWAVTIGVVMGLYAAAWKYLIESCVDFVWETVPEFLLEKGIFTEPDGRFPLYHYMWICPALFGGILSYVFVILPNKIPDQNEWINNIHSRGVEDYRTFWILFVLSTLGMSSGLSLGPELPLVLTSGMAGSWLGIMCKQSVLQARVMNLTAASAAVGGFFGFPMAGALFVLGKTFYFRRWSGQLTCFMYNIYLSLIHLAHLLDPCHRNSSKSNFLSFS